LQIKLVQAKREEMFVRRCVALHGIAISAVGSSVECIFYKPLTKALDERDNYIPMNKIEA